MSTEPIMKPADQAIFPVTQVVKNFVPDFRIPLTLPVGSEAAQQATSIGGPDKDPAIVSGDTPNFLEGLACRMRSWSGGSQNLMATNGDHVPPVLSGPSCGLLLAPRPLSIEFRATWGLS